MSVGRGTPADEPARFKSTPSFSSSIAPRRVVVVFP
jgi:hypothetical protein